MILTNIRYSSVCHGGAFKLMNVTTSSALVSLSVLPSFDREWPVFRFLKELDMWLCVVALSRVFLLRWERRVLARVSIDFALALVLRCAGGMEAKRISGSDADSTEIDWASSSDVVGSRYVRNCWRLALAGRLLELIDSRSKSVSESSSR